jgi:N-acetylglutamate synthase
MAVAHFTPGEVRAFEQALARAWPAGATAELSGWTWRCSGGGSRRANSVHAVTFAGGDVDAAIADVEARYRTRGLKSYFHISTISQPADLDVRLAARGYAFEEPCRLLAKKLSPVPYPGDVETAHTPGADWLTIFTETLDAARRAAAPAQLARTPERRAFFLVRRSGLPAACALGVISPEGTAVVECVATRSHQRRTGAAQTVMDALESWAASNGATHAVLQVVETNTPARTLYARRGYSEAARYHYRWKDV